MGGGRLGEASNLLPEALLLSPSSENSAALSDAILSGTIRPLNESPSTSSHRAEIRPFPPQVHPQKSKPRDRWARHQSARHSRCLLTKYLLLASRDGEAWPQGGKKHTEKDCRLRGSPHPLPERRGPLASA